MALTDIKLVERLQDQADSTIIDWWYIEGYRDAYGGAEPWNGWNPTVLLDDLKGFYKFGYNDGKEDRRWT